jgi:hypothetical protein
VGGCQVLNPCLESRHRVSYAGPVVLLSLCLFRGVTWPWRGLSPEERNSQACSVGKESWNSPSFRLRLSKGWPGWFPTARNVLTHPPTHWHAKPCHLPGRGPSGSSTSPAGVGRLFFTARIERPLLYRGGSASKKNGLPAPSHPSDAARCVSTGDGQATPSSFVVPASSPPS